jgi:hypothetical protein
MVGFTYPIVYTGISITIWIRKASPKVNGMMGIVAPCIVGLSMLLEKPGLSSFVVVHWAKNIIFLWFNKDHRGIIMGYA